MVKVSSFSPTTSTFLNFLRAFAAQIVVVGHAIAIGNVWPAAGEPNSPYMQSLGVVMFFVLSGFVITHTTRLKVLAPESNYSLGMFTIDRFSRIYTVYAPGLILVLILTSINNVLTTKAALEGLGIDQLFGNLFMLQSHPFFSNNWFSHLLGGPLGHIEAYGLGRPFWSIAMEWWFYLAFGFIYFFLKVWSDSSYVKKFWLTAGLLVSLIIPVTQLKSGHFTLLLSWTLGCAISFALPLVQRILAKASNTLISIVGALVLVGSPVPLYLLHKSAYSISFVLFFALGLLLCVVGLQQHLSKRFTKVAAFYADYSYSLYAIHYPIVVLFLLIPMNPIVWLVAVVVTSNVVAYWFAQAFEIRNRPFRKYLVKRLF